MAAVTATEQFSVLTPLAEVLLLRTTEEGSNPSFSACQWPSVPECSDLTVPHLLVSTGSPIIQPVLPSSLKKGLGQGVVAHSGNPSTLEIEV